jgi:hypothetical protein
MRRPPLTRKVIGNLQSLWGFAQGEIDTYNAYGIDPLTEDALDAIEWIKRVSAWKTEQEEKRKEKTI